MSRETVDRRHPPATGAAPPFSFPPFRRERLANGLDLYLARLPRAPLVSLLALYPAGGQFDPLGRPGIASFHGQLLDDGTTHRSATEIATEVEHLGGSLGSSSGWNMAYLELGVLSRHLDSALELMAEATLTPSFPEEELERLRQRRLVEVEQRKEDPKQLGDHYLDQLIYRGTVYGQPLTGTAASLKSITRRDLQDFNHRMMRPNGSAIIAVGDLDPDTVAGRVGELFGGWQPAEAVTPPVIAPRPLDGLEIVLIDRPGAAQTQLTLGHVGVARDIPDFTAVRLLNAVLGGVFTSRLNLNLREKHGVTYSVQSSFTYRQGPGPFRIRAAVANESVGTAVTETLDEIRRLQTELVPADELEGAQSYLVDIFPYTLQTISDLSKRLEALAVFGLDDGYYERYPAELHQVDATAIREAARQRLDPERMVVIAVGDAELLGPQLEALGTPRRITPDEVVAPVLPAISG